jgi:hypothetical protein
MCRPYARVRPPTTSGIVERTLRDRPAAAAVLAQRVFLYRVKRPRLELYSLQENVDLGRRSQVMNALGCGGLQYAVSVLGRHIPMAQPKHAIAAHRAAEHWTPVGPTFRRYKETLYETLRYPAKMGR